MESKLVVFPPFSPKDAAISPPPPSPTPNIRFAPLFARAADLISRTTRRGFWPMLDQGIVSIGNFFTGIIAVRGLEKHDYGTFGVMLEFMFFLNSLQAGLITYPLTVKAAVDDNGLRRLVSASAFLTLLLGIPLLVLAIVLGGALDKFSLGLMAVVALILWQVQETLRRGQWAAFKHQDAVVGDTISYIGQAVGVLVLLSLGKLTLVGIFAVMTLTSGIAVLVQAFQIGVRRVRWNELPAIARDFFSTGRWVALTNVTSIVGAICGSWALWFFHSSAQVADFFAIGNLLKLCNPIQQSVAGLITPGAAKKLAQSGIKAAERISLEYIGLGLAMAAPYLLFLLIAPAFAIRLLYGPDTPYISATFALRGCVIGYFFLYITQWMAAFFNGIGKSHLSFYGQVMNTIAHFFILLPLNIKYGLNGAVWGGVIEVFLQFILLSWLMRRVLRSPEFQSTS